MSTVTETTFWIVWNPEGRNPKVMHRFHDKAKAEAMRLAIAHPGERFFVMEAIDCYQNNSVQHTVFEREIPF